MAKFQVFFSINGQLTLQIMNQNVLLKDIFNFSIQRPGL